MTRFMAHGSKILIGPWKCPAIGTGGLAPLPVHHSLAPLGSLYVFNQIVIESNMANAPSSKC